MRATLFIGETGEPLEIVEMGDGFLRHPHWEFAVTWMLDAPPLGELAVNTAAVTANRITVQWSGWRCAGVERPMIAIFGDPTLIRGAFLPPTRPPRHDEVRERNAARELRNAIVHRIQS